MKRPENTNALGRLRQPILVIVMTTLLGVPAAGSGAQTTVTTRSETKTRTASKANGLSFEIKCAAKVRTEPIKGRVYVMLASDQAAREPRFGPNWFQTEPFYAVNVESWKPGEPLRIDSRSDGFPGPLDELEPGRYSIQAVVRLNPDTHKIGDGEGNAYGPVVHAALDPREGGTVALMIDQVVPPRTFESTERIKLVELASPKLSAFYHRPIKHRAAVILPNAIPIGDRQASRPVIYIIPGFGGDHHMASLFADNPRLAFGKEFIRVVLDPDCGTGHHVFADSATNGPRGAALVEEFIPHIERTFPALAYPRARLLNGHSSGGWSSLWLQVTYPQFFGGTWSTSPDPVDFRDFSRIDLYKPGENMYRDRDGKPRPIARRGTVPVLFIDRFSKVDDVIGYGSQLGSFEAVFSPLDRAGRPRKLWDRATGAIDPAVSKAWEAFDIRLTVERNWPALGPKLKGKLHVITGGLDTFYLEGAVKLLKESLAMLGSDAVVEIVPDRDHFTLMDPQLAQRLDREMHKAVSNVFPARPITKD
ncbi:MAG: alpha/beta hydrolase-fold protein [Isosphaerales bacterium]